MITEINERDLISMKLLHYFITKRNYSPIIVQGVENEIWLENLDEDYKVVRIVNSYIHNDEQMDFDVFKTKRMIKKIKRKTFSWNIKVLSILTDVGENVNQKRVFNDVDVIFYTEEEKLLDNALIKEHFSDLKNNLQYSEEGFQLFLKITDEINQKNRRDAIENDRILEPKKPVITYALMAVIAFIFVLRFFIDPYEIVYYLGNNHDLVKMGEYYRLLTASFVHIDIIHLACNMYALYAVGSLTESYYGKKKFLVIYFIGAIAGSLLSIIMSESFSIGASGAIFGLLGALLYFGFHYRVYFGSVLLNKIVPVIILNLFIGFMIPGIDNFAHIGGLIGGFLISKALGINSKDKKSDKINGLILTILFLIFLIFLGIIKV